MAVEKLTETEQKEEYSVAQEQMNWRSAENEKNRQLERDLKKLDVDGQVSVKKLEANAAYARLRTVTRSDVARRFLLALVKLPVLPLVIICIMVLKLSRLDPIEALDNFLEL